MRTLFTADRLLPDARLEIEDAALLVEGERIAWVGARADAPAADETVDLGDAVLTPGLVNAHSHLDLTHLRGQVPYDGDFVAWIDAIRTRRDRPGMRAAAQAGIREAIARGTTAFGDIVAPGSFDGMLAAFAETGARGRLFVEAIGFRPDVADRVFERVWDLVEMQALPAGCDTGVSPHAPYSVSGALLDRLVGVADGHGRPLAIHVGETLEELAFLRHGIGPLREFLRRLGADDEEHVAWGSLPKFLERLQDLSAPLLLVHGNYLRPRDVPPGAFLVYCPTAHHFFNHPEHAVLELVEEGVRVALGSDSAASGDTVDVLSETQFLARARLDLDARTTFQMATEWGARALGFDSGRLEPGKLADLAAFTPNTAHEILGRTDAECTLTVVGGKILHHTDPTS